MNEVVEIALSIAGSALALKDSSQRLADLQSEVIDLSYLCRMLMIGHGMWGILTVVLITIIIIMWRTRKC